MYFVPNFDVIKCRGKEPGCFRGSNGEKRGSAREQWGSTREHEGARGSSEGVVRESVPATLNSAIVAKCSFRYGFKAAA